jgi:uncharacterized membrane protein
MKIPFWLITLSEIASRALSPQSMTPAIQIISSHVRLFSLWPKQVMGKGRGKDNDRIAVPELVIEIYLKMLLDL